jgi:hypothetical protein
VRTFADVADANIASATEEQAKKLRDDWLQRHRPALQNIPVRTALGRAVRAALTKPPVLDVDYVQIERRVLR